MVSTECLLSRGALAATALVVGGPGVREARIRARCKPRILLSSAVVASLLEEGVEPGPKGLQQKLRGPLPEGCQSPPLSEAGLEPSELGLHSELAPFSPSVYMLPTIAKAVSTLARGRTGAGEAGAGAQCGPRSMLGQSQQASSSARQLVIYCLCTETGNKQVCELSFKSAASVSYNPLLCSTGFQTS